MGSLGKEAKKAVTPAKAERAAVHELVTAARVGSDELTGPYGSLNSITKQATPDFDFYRLSTGFGTDRHTRLTLDANKRFTDRTAIRVNALYAYEEVPDRGPADRERKGLAVSGLFLPTDRMQVVLDYYGLRARDNPDLGASEYANE